MISYRIINKQNLDWDFIFGIDNIDDNMLIRKFNNGVAKIRPYNQCVPYYKGMTFSITSLNGLKYFLYGICNFSPDELKEFLDLGYDIIKEDLEVYSKGLSKLLCTKYNDEVNSTAQFNLKSIINNNEYIDIDTPYCSNEDINFCQAQYYTNCIFFK